MLKYCLYRYKTRDICRTLVNVYPVILRYVPDWFVTPKMLAVLYNKNLDFNDFYKPFTWHNKYNQRKAYKSARSLHFPLPKC